MLIIIAHDGSSEHVKFVKEISKTLEDELGVTCDFSISYPNRKLSFFNDELQEIVSYGKVPDPENVLFHIQQYLNNEEE